MTSGPETALQRLLLLGENPDRGEVDSKLDVGLPF